MAMQRRDFTDVTSTTRETIIEGLWVIATGVERVGVLACLYAPTGSHEGVGRMPLQVQRSRLSMTRDCHLHCMTLHK
jgi:hypothetical protein